MSHAQRFDSVGAQRGTGLAAVVDALKTVAQVVEEWYDAGSPQVVTAMQRFEQGLASISRAPAAGSMPEANDDGGEAQESEETDASDDGSDTKPKATRRKPKPSPMDEKVEG